MSFRARLETLETKRRELVTAASRFAAPVIVLGFAAVVLVAMTRRLSLGVDLTDDAFATALAYRFALGARPFVDELNSSQTAALIVTPLVWLYVKATHGTAGIVLFMRVCFLVFRLAVGASVFAAIRRRLPFGLALTTSFFCVVFVPFSIPNLGYNVLGSGFLTMALFAALRAGQDDSGRLVVPFFGGVAAGLAVVAYPPLAVPVLVLVGILFVRLRLSQTSAFVLGGVLIALLLVPLVVRAGVPAVRAMVEFGARITPRPPSKLLDVVLALISHMPVPSWAMPLLAAAFAWLRRRQPAWSPWGVLALTVTLALSFPGGTGSQLSVVAQTALVAPVLLPAVWDDETCRRAFVFVWIPSSIAGLLTAFTSSNGEPNAALGLFPAAVVFLLFAATAATAARPAVSAGEVHERVAPLAAPLLLTLSLLGRFAFSVYRDAPVQELEYRVPTGPFRGIRTAPATATLLAEMEAVLSRHRLPSGKLLAYWDLPGAYLFTDMAPASNSIWISQMADPDGAAASYRAKADANTVAVKLKSSANNVTPLDQHVDGSGRLLESTPRFVVHSGPGAP